METIVIGVRMVIVEMPLKETASFLHLQAASVVVWPQFVIAVMQEAYRKVKHIYLITGCARG